jgi:hypothetical protein
MEQERVLDDILSSLENYPNMQFMLFTNFWNKLEKKLDYFIKVKEHSLLVYQTKNLNISKNSYRKIRDYSLKQKRYNLQGKLYNYIFIHYLPEDLKSFSKKIYSSLTNGGRVYLLVDSKENFWNLATKFEESNYVSINKIELDSNKAYITAKKMHGWGD